jgi:hypothetical protein
MLQRQVAGHEEHDLQPRGTGSGGGFQPDPTGANDHYPFCPAKFDLDALTVLHIAQVVHAVEIGAGEVKSARFRTRG